MACNLPNSCSPRCSRPNPTRCSCRSCSPDPASDRASRLALLALVALLGGWLASGLPAVRGCAGQEARP